MFILFTATTLATSTSSQHAARENTVILHTMESLELLPVMVIWYGIVHYPEHARGLASQSIYDIVCCGHSHVAETVQFENTLMINPGHLLGENRETGFTILDLTDLSTERVKVGTCMFDLKIPVESEKS